MDYENYTYVFYECDCDGQGLQFKDFLEKKYPELTIEYIEREGGLGGGLYDPEGNEVQNYFWDEYCNS